jgi:hypothetical protein
MTLPAVARSTVPLAFADVGVGLIVGMAGRAVRTSELLGGDALASEDIFAARDWLQVSGVYARSTPTQMVQIKPVRDDSVYEPVGEAVSAAPAVIAVPLVELPLPYQAVTFGHDVHPEPLLKRAVHGVLREERVAVVEPSGVVPHAPAPCASWCRAIGNEAGLRHVSSYSMRNIAAKASNNIRRAPRPVRG